MHWYVTIFKNCPEFPRTDVTLQNQIWTQIYVLAGDNLQKLFGFCSYIRVYPDRVKTVPIYKLCVASPPPLPPFQRFRGADCDVCYLAISFRYLIF